MPLSPRHWRARHLLGAWLVYWAALVAVTLAPAARAAWRISRQPPNTASATVDFGDGVFRATITSFGARIWSGTATYAEVVLWLVGPPLLLWLLWAALRPRVAHDPSPLPAAPRHADPALPGASLADPLPRDRQVTRERR